LIGRIREYHPGADFDSIERAYRLAVKIHQGQQRLSGEKLSSHLLDVALSVAEIRLGEASIITALLHESLRKGNLSEDFLRREFGEKVADYVTALTELSQTSLIPKSPQLSDTLKKIFLLLAKDIRVALIRLADRVENVKNIHSLPPEYQAWTARQALNFYAPIAEILGVYHFKWQLEDHAFAVLRPEIYQAITKQLSLDREEMEKAIENMKAQLIKALNEEGVSVEAVFGRAKNIYSIYKKLLRYQKEGKVKDLLVRRIYDQMALMILVEEEADCYRALGIVNKLFQFLSGEFGDYIAQPKPNGYQAIHMVVRDEARRVFEVQIRTTLMHEKNEFGEAAHLFYKKGERKYEQGVNKEETDWLKRLSDWSQASVEEIFSDRVFVFSPKSDVFELPAGATPVDYAYAVHTGLGDSCRGAKVDGRLVSLDYQLKSGQVVEIIPSKTKKGPSRDWLGFVVTRMAKSKIAAYFRKG